MRRPGDKASTTPLSKAFAAPLERGGERLNWTVVRIPFDVQKLFGVRGQLRVKGAINGFPFRTTLFPTGSGRHILMVNKQMRAGGKVSAGAVAKFQIERDTEERVLNIPAELQRELRADKDLARYFTTLNASSQRDIASWVAEARQEATRQRRAGQLAERLYLTMEAEQGDLPPALKAAFARFPKARDGWEKMPPSHKRQHLLGIFYYRNPEAQARRIQKAIDMMMEYADRPARRSRA
jgi:uncharacterized protein YdeI (YjbR/CyaY-like superfamily)